MEPPLGTNGLEIYQCKNMPWSLLSVKIVLLKPRIIQTNKQTNQKTNKNKQTKKQNKTKQNKKQSKKQKTNTI